VGIAVLCKVITVSWFIEALVGEKQRIAERHGSCRLLQILAPSMDVIQGVVLTKASAVSSQSCTARHIVLQVSQQVEPRLKRTETGCHFKTFCHV